MNKPCAIDRLFARIGAIVLICGVLAHAQSAERQEAPAGNEFRVVGYLPDYRLADFDLAAAQGVTDLIVFSGEPTAQGDLDLSRLEVAPWAKLRAWKTRQRTRLLLSLGGWDRSRHFAAMAASETARRKFVERVTAMCLAERLDGVDLDWEHPQGEAEQRDYGKLLAELHTAFEPKGLVLSVTVAAWQGISKEAIQAVDWVQIMAYDHEGRHATFEGAQADSKSLLEAGVPPEKLVLGLPFYGRGIERREETLTYREILAKWRPKPSVDEVSSVYFNGPETIRRKTNYARKENFGGVLLWELGQDAAGEESLLAVIRDSVDAKGE